MNDIKGIIEDCNKSDLVSNKVIEQVIALIGQEEWNDLNDDCRDICTTMGELIITLKGIPELEAQIEKMKLCQNCRFESYDDMKEPCRNCSRLLGDIKRKGTSDKWEMTND